MKFKLWREYGALNSKPVFDAFAKGLENLGYKSVNDNSADVDVIWSVLFQGRMLLNKTVWDNAKRAGRPVIVLEVGGISRGTTWKIGLNGINKGSYFKPESADNSRAAQLGLTLQPWRINGEFIIICGQHNKSLQWHNMPAMSKWVMDTIDTIQQFSKRTIIIRPHPRCPLPHIENQFKNVYNQTPIHISGTYDSFNLNFSNTWATVSWNSNPGSQSIIAGVPAFVSESSLASPVANIDLSNIENPSMPDRQQWLNELAYTEYTIKEIENGMPIKNLTHMMQHVKF
jgi:hypothetical protein